MKTIKLEPCKICGCKETTITESNTDGYYHAYCNGCFDSTCSYETKEEVLEELNSRRRAK